MWLQTQRDVTLERQRAPGLSPRREDPHEFRVGRLKHERVKVPRGEQLLDWAMQVMRIHADRKSILEVHCQYCFISVVVRQNSSFGYRVLLQAEWSGNRIPVEANFSHLSS